MTDGEWLALIREEKDEGWKRVWERVIEPESASLRSAEMMQRYSLTAGDLMGMLYYEMIGRRKIELFRGEGSLEGWLKRYVRGFVLNANPNRHGEISIETAHADSDGASAGMDLPTEDGRIISKDVWISTHYCFHDLWRFDPERAYVHLLKTRFHLSSEETRDFLEISSTANVDQIFSRNVKFMRQAWERHEKNGH
ncbi:MAG: hypothetical protein ACI4R9_00950 [Kiritimatiellia bacterium]